MKILIVNDDGLQAAALPVLIRWARKLGEVTCVVPKLEQSGSGQAERPPVSRRRLRSVSS